MRGILDKLTIATVAVGVSVGALGAQRTVCDSPCVLKQLPLVVRKDQPVPNSNPLLELQGKVDAANMIDPLHPPAFFEYQVDKPVAQIPGGPWPHYPDSLRIAKVEGRVVASFIVDTMGVVELTSLHILKSTDALFAAAVREVLPKLRFTPAELHGAKVRQLVQQPFIFSISR
jgi:TonB family protein